MAKDLAQHLGDRTAMEKARKAAALELATADARAKIDHYLPRPASPVCAA